MTWAEHITRYYFELDPPRSLPGDVQWLHPQKEKEVRTVINRFYKKFYDDEDERMVMLGINPGRFGAGVTGVNFTAPRQLKQNCGIDHSFKDQSELSAEFIYEMIESFGGPLRFYKQVFIGSVCPLGLMKHGKNVNYYDEKPLLSYLQPFIVQTIDNLLKGVKYNNTCIAIGGEKNFKFLSGLNASHKWFENIIPLPHPRFIMQYRRPYKLDFLQQYHQVLESVLNKKKV